eukprot:NODE_222_length_13951_cov_0.396982.p10 type:complete len:132 gc:universal NODE_222_length_13951_cov_0.396982:4130-4525(+)
MEEEKLRRLQGPPSGAAIGRKDKGEFDDLISSIKSGKAFMQKKPDKLMKKKKSNVSVGDHKSLSQRSSSSFVAELKDVQSESAHSSMRVKASTAPAHVVNDIFTRDLKRNPSIDNRVSKTDEMMKKMNQRI